MSLLEPKVRRLAPEPPIEPPPDRVPDSLSKGTAKPLRNDLVTLLGSGRVLGRVSDLVRYASDASPYRKIPQVVVSAHNLNDIVKLFAYARSSLTPLTFRSGGTSLNGQGQSDSILVDVRRHFGGVTVLDGGARAWVRPGTVLGQANQVLAPYGRKLGPDPASTDAATIGGVIANNSGGMRCGTWHDSYSTLAGLVFALPSGTVVDTTDPEAAAHFAAAEPTLVAGLIEIRDEIRADQELCERIRHKFKIKNTMGYRLCAFLDADEPLEIFRRLIVGSEGTLAFIGRALFETVALPPRHSAALLHFSDLESAAAAVPGLVECGSTATELMVAASMIVAAWNMPGVPEAWRELPPESAAVLVEFGADDEAGLDEREQAALATLDQSDLIRPARFSRDPEEVELYWRVREGMFGLIGALRAPGTALITEDVCVPPDRVAEAAIELRELLAKHGFLAGVAGHASVGNLHFTLTPDFAKPEDLARYEAFIEEMTALIVDKYDGSLKAEHGTGVNMAPYLEREWGAKATALMWRVKELADPDEILNPGVILNRDPGCHLANLMTTPTIEDEANSCVECGMCEPVCPSRDLTITPRQRIVLRREMARQPAGSPVLKALLDRYEYDGIETCAADSTCKLACPLGIDTGALVKQFRAGEHSERAESTARRVAERWASVERGSRAALRVGSGPAGGVAMRAAAASARAVFSDELVPRWPSNMPNPAPATLPETDRDGAAALYFPSCLNRIFGKPRGDSADSLPLPEALIALSARAGRPLWIPPKIAGHCCSTPWVSKGYKSGAAYMANLTVEALWGWSDRGALPIVCDAASCSLGLIEDAAGGLDPDNAERHSKLTIIDSIAWVHDHLLDRLEVSAKLGRSAGHPPCSARLLGLEKKLRSLAEAVSTEVAGFDGATCCGFAGDRGFLHPELTAAAAAPLAQALGSDPYDAHVCANRTCEIGLETATGQPYESIVQLLERATRT